jgi:hypothetical protein
VEDRLRLFLWIQDKIVRPSNNWIPKSCDVNKDIEIKGLAKLTLPNIQIPLFGKALRTHVKRLEDRAFYRVELGLVPNKPEKRQFNTIYFFVLLPRPLESYQ